MPGSKDRTDNEKSLPADDAPRDEVPAAARPAAIVSTPAQRWLTPTERETLRARLKKRFH